MQLRSNLWKELAAFGGRKMETVVVIDGHEYAPKGDVAISRSAGQNALSIGNTITATVQFSVERVEGVTIPNTSAAVVKVRYVDGERVTEWMERGTFYVSRRRRNIVSDILDLQGYDAMIKADAPYPSLSGFPKAMNAAVMEIARNMGVEVDGRTWADFPTGADYYVPLPANGEKMIKVLGYIGGVCGGNWIITPQGKLRLVPLASASGAASAPASDKAIIAAVMSAITAGEPATVTGVAASGQNGMIAGTDDGAVVSMAQNPYVTQSALNALLTRYNGLTYQPYEIKSGIYDPAAEIGDYLISREDVASVLWSENATYAPMFRGDVSAPFLAEASGSEQSVSDAISGAEGGYEDLSVRIYNFSNQSAVTIGDGQSAEIINFDYAAGSGQDVVFHAEIKHTTETTETGNASVGWTCTDAVLTVTYYINGAEVAAYHPTKSEMDGANLLHLTYHFQNGQYNAGNFRVTLSLSGGSVTIPAGNARAYIIGQGYAGGVGDWVSDAGLVFIGAESYPNALNYVSGDTLDLTGLVVKAYYADGTDKDVTAQCAISPRAGSTLSDGETLVSVSYAEGGKTFSDSFSVYCDGDGYKVLYIEVTQPPNKTEYLVGESLDLAGLAVSAVQENGCVVSNIKPDCQFSPAEGDALTEPGTVTVTVTRRYLEPLDYGTFTAYFDVTVENARVIAEGDWWTLYATGLLHIYCEGDMPDYNGNGSPWYSYRAQIASVTIGDSVTSIGSYAFYNCSGLTSVTIPDSVTSIGRYAFYYCTALKSVTIPDSVTSIGGGAFRYCSALTSVTIPDSVTSIGDDVFSDCTALKSVTIPDSVTSIGDDVFYGSGLTSVTIPDSVTSIGGGAFYWCSRLESIDVESGNNYYASENGVLFNKDKSLLAQYPEGKSNAMYIIPDSVTSIGDNAFHHCSPLTSVTIPDGVTSIGRYAFNDCSRLTSVTIGDSVTSIGSGAFYNCIALKSVTIPDSVTSIGDDVFYGSGLTSVTIPDSVTSIGGGAFRYCSALTSVTIGDSVTSIGSGAFYRCSRLADVYYGGTETQWGAISIASYNDPLLNATIHYNSAGPA